MSQYIFKEAALKGRLIKKAQNWYVAEYKTDGMPSWFPYICGTAEWLRLTEQDKEWAKA